MNSSVNESSITEALTKERLVSVAVITTFLSLVPTAYAALVSNSTTLLADLLRCVAEFAAIFLSWIILRKVAKAETSRFNYGFGKLEQLACVAVAASLFGTFLLAFVLGIRRIISPETVVNAEFGLALALLSVVGNGSLWILNHVSFSKTSSPVADSQWRLFRAKTLATVVVVLSLSGALFLPHFSWSAYIDGVGSVGLSLFMLWSAYSLISSSVPDLIDCALEETLEQRVREILKGFEDKYIALERMRSRRVIKRVHLELFISFQPGLSFGSVHETVMSVKGAILQHLPGADVLVIPSISEPAH
jgi:ferrous-iron efflux pump FieF